MSVPFFEKGIGLPPARADRRNAARHDHDLLDTFGQHAILEREAGGHAAEGRRIAHGGIEQVGQAHVDAVGRRPGHLRRNVEALNRLADDLEFRRLLERWRRTLDEIDYGIDEVAETRAPGAVRAADLAIGHDQIADRHGKFAAGGAQQQVARHGTSPAHRQPGIARRRRSTGRHDAQNTAQLAGEPLRHIHRRAGLLRRERQAVDQDVDVAVDGVFGRIFDLHLVPAGVHLLSHQHGQRGVDALPHLGSRHGHDHRVVAEDFHPAVEAGLVRLDVEQLATAQPVALAGEPPADTNETHAYDAADDRLAPGELHGTPPRIAAARWMARRMAL